MIIREASLKDLNQISELFNAYRVFYKKESDLMRSMQFIKERFELNESVLFVAESDHILLGFTQLYPLFSSTRLSRTWLLNDQYVDPNHRGKKIGKALLKKAQEFTISSGAIALSLETAKDNYIGNGLYPAMGFTLDQDHNYYTWSAKKRT